MIHLDTSFLVDLLRERAGRGRSHQNRAGSLFERLRDEELAVSRYVACELMAGVAAARDPRREHRTIMPLVQELRIAEPEDSVAFADRYGTVLAHLKKAGEPIATMDLLIAITALDAGAPLVTRNVRHFQRVPGLEVIEY